MITGSDPGQPIVVVPASSSRVTVQGSGAIAGEPGSPGVPSDGSGISTDCEPGHSMIVPVSSSFLLTVQGRGATAS